jgi:hypothetical protein
MQKSSSLLVKMLIAASAAASHSGNPIVQEVVEDVFPLSTQLNLGDILGRIVVRVVYYTEIDSDTVVNIVASGQGVSPTANRNIPNRQPQS